MLLLDTHVLLWAAYTPDRLSADTQEMLLDPEKRLCFSVVSIWEVAIKRALDRPDFQIDAGVLRRGLLSNGYEECPIEGPHALHVSSLPMIHRDPFDRMLVAQAAVEGMALITADKKVAAYHPSIQLI